MKILRYGLVLLLWIAIPVAAFGAIGDCTDVVVVTPDSCTSFQECEVLNEDGTVAGVIRFRFQPCV